MRKIFSFNRVRKSLVKTQATALNFEPLFVKIALKPKNHLKNLQIAPFLRKR
jgi:hypothetical protein